MERIYMIEYRRKHKLSLKHMAEKCQISATLLSMLEKCEQEVTHPKIAERIGKEYLTALPYPVHVNPKGKVPKMIVK